MPKSIKFVANIKGIPLLFPLNSPSLSPEFRHAM